MLKSCNPEFPSADFKNSYQVKTITKPCLLSPYKFVRGIIIDHDYLLLISSA